MRTGSDRPVPAPPAIACRSNDAWVGRAARAGLHGPHVGSSGITHRGPPSNLSITLSDRLGECSGAV
jgi:hypothetical protein